MLESHASSGESLFADVMSSFASSDSESSTPDLPPRSSVAAIGDYALFLLEQQEGYCQLV